MSKNLINLKPLLTKAVMYIGVLSFILLASPLFLPSAYTLVVLAKGYEDVIPWVSLVISYLFLAGGLISDIVFFGPREGWNSCVGIILWSSIGYILTLYLFTLPTIIMGSSGHFTLDEPLVAMAVSISLVVLLWAGILSCRIRYSLALYALVLLVSEMRSFEFLTVFRAHVVGTVLAFVGMVLIGRIFKTRYVKCETKDCTEPKRPNSPSPPEGCARSNTALTLYSRGTCGIIMRVTKDSDGSNP